MNSANGGDILFHFKGDSKNFDKEVGGLSSKVKGIGKTIGTTFLAGTAIATGAVIGFVKSATQNFAEFEQLEGGLDAMFQGNAESIKRVTEASKNAYKDLQMSQNEYLNSFESSYAIVKNGLGENADAIEYTNKILQLSADLFNTYGGSTEQYSNAINWALKGNYSYLDNLNLGIKGTQEGFIEAANNAGILGREIKDVKDLTNDEIINVIQHYAEETGAWGRSTAEASQTIAGSLNMTKSSWQNLITEFGKADGDVSGAFDNLMSSLDALFNNLLPVIQRVLESVVQYLPGIIEKIGAMLPGLVQQLVPPLINAGVQLFKALVDALPTIINVLVDALPVILTALIEGLTQIVIGLADAMPTLIPQLVDAILGIIPVLIDNAPLFIEAGFQLLLGLALGIIKSIPKILSAAKQIGISFLNYLKTLPSQTVKIGGDLIRGLWQGIKDLGQWVISKIKGLGSSILKSVKNIFGIHSPSTEFAFIGRMNMVGLEEGMEDMQPEIQKTIDSLFDLSPNLTGAMNTHYSPNIVVNNNVSMETDPLGQTVSRIKTFSGGAKNDYNYGMGG